MADTRIIMTGDMHYLIGFIAKDLSLKNSLVLNGKNLRLDRIQNTNCTRISYANLYNLLSEFKNRYKCNSLVFLSKLVIIDSNISDASKASDWYKYIWEDFNKLEVVNAIECLNTYINLEDLSLVQYGVKQTFMQLS